MLPRRVASPLPSVDAPPLDPLLPESYRRVFALTREAAVSVLKRRLRTLTLLRDALGVLARNPRPFKATREDTALLIRLVLAWQRRSYRKVPWRSLVLIAAALIYLVYPLDVLFDGLPLIGYSDDATILGTVAHALRVDLDRFRLWEQPEPTRPPRTAVSPSE
jgi:uncharacterized membrane protein YkvA (DUF1232 family)